MSKVTDETIVNSYKPYDIVSDDNGCVGIIQEVSVNESQEPPNQISYAVTWLTGGNNKHAWFYQSELTKHCNLFVKIAQMSCSPFSNNDYFVPRFFEVKALDSKTD